MHRFIPGIVLIAASLVFSTAARAASQTYNIDANGAKEVTAGGVPNQGDPDGTAIGTIILDNGTGSGLTGSAQFSLIVSFINGGFSAHHIHVGVATTTGSPVLDFGDPDTILTGTSASGTLSGTITNLSATTITGILASPFGFYYNLHTSPDFPGGAVRSQLPEPAGFATILLAMSAGILKRRRA